MTEISLLALYFYENQVAHRRTTTQKECQATTEGRISVPSPMPEKGGHWSGKSGVIRGLERDSSPRMMTAVGITPVVTCDH